MGLAHCSVVVNEEESVRAIIRVIEYPHRGDHIDITPLYDLHVGNAACDEVLLRQIVKKIQSEKNHYWIGGGDMADYINRKDRRHRETALASWLHGVDDLARMQRDRVISILEPIKDKCLGLLRGNHESDFLRYYEVDIYASMVDRLRIDHKTKIMLGIQGFIILRMMRKSKGAKTAKGDSWPIRIYCHHGYGGGRLEGGHALTLGRMFKDYDCDIGLMGHRHVKQVLPRTQTSVTRSGRIFDRYQVGAFCGSFLKSYSEDEVYAEERGLPALPLGPIRLRLWPTQRRIEVTV